MANLEAKHLLRTKRFNENDWKFITLVCYLPFGLILCLLRSVLALCVFLLGYILPDNSFSHKIINKITCLSLGITVSIESFEKNDTADVYISNSISLFDNLAVHLATGATSVGSKLPPLVAKSLGVLDSGTPSNVENLKQKIQAVQNKTNTSLYFAPEGKNTNGKALIKFETYPFYFAQKVQPVCINVERPFLDISVNNLGSSTSADIFYFMFSPLTSYKLKFLAVMEKKNLSEEEFADIVRQNLAAALNVETVELTKHDLNEWEKRQLAERKRTREPTVNPSRNTLALRRMALQVKEVLPHVPLDVIHRDLHKSRNVDNTITNILEGRVQFIPETTNSSVSQGSSGSSTSRNRTANIPATSSSTMNTAASTFSKSAQERNKSFQERKEQLIANARKRYIEKHNLDIPV